MSTPTEVAKWMYSKVEEDKVLCQDEVVAVIQERFGEEFVYTNNNGYLCIDRAVLKAFRALSAKDVVWVSGSKSWRLRGTSDEPGKRQAY